MGRTRTKTKKTIPVVSTASDSASKATPSVPALLEKAQELIVQCDYTLAHMFVKRILHREPEHAEAREMMGVILLETGEVDDARSVSRPHDPGRHRVFSAAHAVGRYSCRWCRPARRRPRRPRHPRISI